MKLLEQLKLLLVSLSDPIIILDKELNARWQNFSVSFDWSVDKNGLKSSLESMNKSKFQVDINTTRGIKIAYLVRFDDYLVLHVPPAGFKRNRQSATGNYSAGDFSDTYVHMSRVMGDTVNIAKKAAGVDANILLTGETGVGKSLLAKLIHRYSSRVKGPFVPINCSAIPSALLESELFGYEAGAFTGANRTGRIGLLETGQGGTVFLDEIGEMPVELQSKLLHAIDERTIIRIGGRSKIELDIRIISATNKNLDAVVSEGNFREDLYYRLNVISINIPALRERKEDILPLAYNALEKLNKKYNLFRAFDHSILEALENYSWPGNVRELENVIERMIVMADKEMMTIKDVPNHILNGSSTAKQQNSQAITGYTLQAKKNNLERNMIVQVLHNSKSIREAAGKLGISHTTLLRKMKRLKLREEARHD